ncbi:MAG TPA: hypothetical protein VNT76_11610, partial [Candidatus Binatus sp.]|nr:hypothetical protein [Candidatus Binatus sp.]
VRVLARGLRFSLVEPRGGFMDCKMKISVIGLFLSGILTAPATSFTRGHDRWENGSRWDHRWDRRDRYREREQARQQLEYALSHHANGK